MTRVARLRFILKDGVKLSTVSNAFKNYWFAGSVVIALNEDCSMNKSYQNSLLLLLVGLLAWSSASLGVAVSVSGACIQVTAKDEGAANLDDPASVNPFARDPKSVFLPPPREFVKPLRRALRLQDEGDHAGAAELIGEFLVEVGEEDFLIFNDKAKGTAVSVSSIAAEMLGSLPKSALDAYRVRFGIPARQRLDLAIAESNYFEIAQVKQRYLLTDAGYDATLLLAHHHFDAGRPLLAADCFQTALDLVNQKGKSDYKLSVLTAVSWVLARHSERAKVVMRNLAKSTGGKLRLGDQEVTIDDDDPLAAINAFVGSGPLEATSTVDQWLLVGGNAKRKVTTVDGFPVGEPLWEVAVAGGPVAQERVEKILRFIKNDGRISNSISLVPANIPLVVDGLVLVGDKSEIQAVDFRSGKRIWAAKPAAVSASTAQQQSVSGVGRKVVGINYATVRSVLHGPWSDFLQGHSSSDGKFIFRIVKSKETTPPDPNHRNFARRYSTEVKSTSVLQAINVANEGELVWAVGGGNTTGDPRLTQIDFLGAPLPVDGVLYAIGKRLEEIVLVALNSSDGKIVWMQSLASSENSTYGSAIKDNYSFTPSYSDGVLVCPTGKNALVAIDTIGRRLMWGMQTTIGSDSGKRTRRTRVSSALSLVTLQNPQVFVENSHVVAFDVDHEPRVLAMDLLTGSPLMKVGKMGVKCQEVLHVAWVDENQVVMVERKRVRSISSDSGRKLWETSLADYGQPTGRGYVSQSSTGPEQQTALYLPTEGNMIVKIDLNTGKVIDGIRSDRSFGNLIVHQGRVISRREASVACFEIDSRVASELKTAVESAGGIDKVSPELKIKQAALLRNQHRSQQAIELLETIDLQDRSDRFRVELLKNVTLMFGSDPDFALETCREYGSWFKFESNPQLFVEYVELLVENNRPDDALKQIFGDEAFLNPRESKEVSEMVRRPVVGYDVREPDEVENKSVNDKPTGKTETPFLKNQKKFSNKRILLDRNHWAKAQLIRMARKNPESVERIRSAVMQRIQAMDSTDVIQRHRFIRKFPLELVSSQLRFELATQLVAEKHVAEAENMFASLLGFLPTKAEQIKTVEDLSKDSLVELWSKIRDGQYGANSDLAGDANSVEFTSAQKFDRVEIATARVPSQYQSDYPVCIDTRGDFARRIFKNKKITVWGRTKELEILRSNGKSEKRFKLFGQPGSDEVNLQAASGWIQAKHSLALLRQKSMVLMMDLSKLDLGQSSVRWRKNVAPLVSSRTSRTDFAGEMDLRLNQMLLPEDVTASFPETGCCCFIDKGELICVDAFTGTTLWKRTREFGHVRMLGNGGQVATMDSRQKYCSVFDIRTGELLRTKEISEITESLFSVDGMNFVASSIVAPEVLNNLKGLGEYRFVGGEELKDDDESNSDKVSSLRKTGRLMSRYDVTRSDFVWKNVFSLDSKICRLSGDRFLVLTGDNLIYVFDVKSGKQLAKMPSGLTEAQRKAIRLIGATKHAGNDLVAMVTAKSGSISTQGVRLRSSRGISSFFTGHVLLLNCDTNEPVWTRPVELTGFHLLPMLPSTSPLLIFNRTVQSTGTGKTSPLSEELDAGNLFQLVALDMNDGHVALNKVFGPVGPTQFASPKVDLVAGTIDMSFRGWEVRLSTKKSSDEPPSAVASVTRDNPIPKNHRVSRPDTVGAAEKFDIEEVNKRLVRQAEEYEASLTEKRAKERALLKSEAGKMQ